MYFSLSWAADIVGVKKDMRKLLLFSPFEFSWQTVLCVNLMALPFLLPRMRSLSCCFCLSFTMPHSGKLKGRSLFFYWMILME